MNPGSDNFPKQKHVKPIANLLPGYCFSLQNHCSFYCSKTCKVLKINNIIETWGEGPPSLWASAAKGGKQRGGGGELRAKSERPITNYES